MKKILSLALASLMVISVLCACGGSNEAAASESQHSSNNQAMQQSQLQSSAEDAEDSTAIVVENAEQSVEEEQSVTAEATQYAIGDAFGTDNVECVIEDVIWFTPEDILSNSSRKLDKEYNVIRLDISSLYPEYKFEGLTGVAIPSTATEDHPEGDPYLCVLYSLQNIGKNEVGNYSFMESTYDREPFGNISVVYDDDYIFDFELGFVSTLEVLGDPLKEGRVIKLKQAVYENEDKPLQLKVSLPNSKGDLEEFYIRVR